MAKGPENARALTSPHRATRRRLWIVAAGVIVVGGTATAVVAATTVARADAGEHRAAIERTSADVASTLELAIHDQESLAVNAAAFVLDNPQASVGELYQWLSSVRAVERYPELEALAELAYIPAAELPTFSAPLTPAGTTISPAGNRPFSCLVKVGFVEAGATIPAVGFDYCGTPVIAASVLETRDTGRSAYIPIAITEGDTRLGVQFPVFRGGTVPATLAERRAAFTGIIGMTLDQNLVLDRALSGVPDVVVSLRHAAGSSAATFSSGIAPADAEHVLIDLQNGWTVHTFSAAASTGVLDNGNSLALLLAGVALSFLLATLVLVLGTGRARAWRLVGERTEELQHQALHDTLTGLPNRALITDRIDQLLVRNRRNGTQGAALFIDLDEFKNVNDTLGHAAGDRLLVAVADRLHAALRDADTIGRMGGDEFVVLVDGASTEAAPELVAERLLAVMRQPFELEGAAMPLVVNTSVGIALGDRATGGALLRDADVALYQAKAAGKNRYEVFYPEMQTEISRRIEVEFDLRSALRGDQFRLVYQPIYNLEDLTLVGVEALLRWDRPSLDAVGPTEFIPILERTGQIRQVGRWVLQEACSQMSRWHAHGHTLDVSVNVSGRQLDTGDVVDDIRDALASSGLDASALIIEVTETALMHNTDDILARLQAISELGVRIAVDDFGTGYSSLAYLQRFPVDCLKIDRLFTHAVTTSPESKALVGTLVQLGRDLGLKTLAEGVETIDEIDHLRQEHVDQAQGFLLARPLDADAFETRLLTGGRDPHALGT